MDEKMELKRPRQMSRKINIEEFTFDDFKKNSHLLSPTSQEVKAKQLARWKSCLCSPTTHVGSFRCRYHRGSSMYRGGSVGSNLSALAGKSEPISDSLQAQ